MFVKHAGQMFKPGMAVLEVGPGRISRSLIRHFCTEWECDWSFCDMKNYNEDHPAFVRMPSAYAIESEDERFDAAVQYELAHNVRRLWVLLPEVARVVKPGGFVVIEDVVSYPEVNRWPVDCGRIFPDGMVVLFEDAGLLPVVNIMGNEKNFELPNRGRLDTTLNTHIVAVGRKP